MMPAITSVTEETSYGRTVDWRLMARLLTFARPHIALLGFALVLVPLNMVLQVAQPWVVKIAVDKHLVTGQLDGFATLLWGLAALILGQLLTGYFLSLTNTLLGHRLVRDMRRALFVHVLSLDAAYFARHASGRITNRLANDTEAVSQMVGAGLVNLVADLLMIVGTGVSMVLLSPRLSVVVVIALPLIILVVLHGAKGLRLLQRRGRLLQSFMANQFTEEIGGHQIIRLFRRQAKNSQQFEKINGEYLDISLDSNLLEAIQFSFLEASGSVVVALLFLYGAYLSAHNPISVGVLVAFIEYVRRIFMPIRELSNRFTTMQAAMTALERIYDLLDTPTAIASPPQAVTVGPTQGEIAFHDVTFAYDSVPVLHSFSCHIPPGQRVAVVGPTGAGKTTLIKLLNRTHDATIGHITIDGANVREISLQRLRRMVGVITQAVFRVWNTNQGEGFHHALVSLR
jgi:ATP-binding cassette subfamily B multidrug efflux pump